MKTQSQGVTAPRTLPARPNLEHLKNEAKQRLDQARIAAPRTKLSEIQFHLAREYGFSSWRELKADLDRRKTAPAGHTAGDWIAHLSADARLALHMHPRDQGGYDVTMDSPDYASFGFGVDGFTLSDDVLSFSLVHPRANAFYRASWDTARQVWAGIWRQNGLTRPLDFARGVFPPAPTIAGLDGTWEGLLDVEGGLRLIFHVRTNAHGTFATCDSPDKNGFNFPASSITRDGQNVVITLKTATVAGELAADDNSLSAVFVRGDLTATVTLRRRVPGEAPLRRPDPTVIDIAPETLASYAGDYTLADKRVLTITMDESGLTAHWPDAPNMRLWPYTLSEFFMREIEGHVIFECDADGGVTNLVLHRQGRDTRAKRNKAL